MILFIEIIKPQLLKIILFLSLLGWALFATFTSIHKKSETLIIALDQNGARLLTSNEDPLLKTELIEFLKTYLLNVYNLSPESLSKNLNLATNMMSEELWKKEKDHILKLQEMVHKTHLIQNAEIEKITQLSSDSFQALILTKQKSRLETKNYEIKVSIKITPSIRSKLNPWGKEITDIKEENFP